MLVLRVYWIAFSITADYYIKKTIQWLMGVEKQKNKKNTLESNYENKRFLERQVNKLQLSQML